jgi:hypothetical protein
MGVSEQGRPNEYRLVSLRPSAIRRNGPYPFAGALPVQSAANGSVWSFKVRDRASCATLDE